MIWLYFHSHVISFIYWNSTTSHYLQIDGTTGQEYTYSSLCDLVQTVAGAMYHEHGVRKVRQLKTFILF